MKKKRIIIFVIVIAILLLIGGFVFFLSDSHAAKKEEKLALELKATVDKCNYHDGVTDIKIGLTNGNEESVSTKYLDLVLKNDNGEVVTSIDLDISDVLEGKTYTEINSTFPGDLSDITKAEVRYYKSK